MKKLLIALFLVLALPLTTLGAAPAPTVILDGKTLTFDVDPIIEEGRILVPLRAIFEAMGAKVDWNSGYQTATAQKDKTVVMIMIGNITPTVNDEVVMLDVPAKIVNGRTLAPLRFVGEAFGGTVTWDGPTQTATITTKK